MAKMGIIPKRMAKCPVPTCLACLYAKAIRRKWRGKTANNSDEATKPSKPGECISVDQLKSPTPGLIAQLSGFLTTKGMDMLQYTNLAYKAKCPLQGV
jgi:hypothetical protein